MFSKLVTRVPQCRGKADLFAPSKRFSLGRLKSLSNTNDGERKRSAYTIWCKNTQSPLTIIRRKPEKSSKSRLSCYSQNPNIQISHPRTSYLTTFRSFRTFPFDQKGQLFFYSRRKIDIVGIAIRGCFFMARMRKQETQSGVRYLV